jgi:hypothetical protein
MVAVTHLYQRTRQKNDYWNCRWHKSVIKELDGVVVVYNNDVPSVIQSWVTGEQCQHAEDAFRNYLLWTLFLDSKSVCLAPRLDIAQY